MKYRSFILTIVLILGSTLISFSQENNEVRTTDADMTAFYEVVSHCQEITNLPLPDLVTEIALHLLETQYVAGTLENEPEMLTVNLRETDCILFVEMCIALAITVKDPHPMFDDYCDVVKKLRYRGGVVDGYASRIHYTSEWIQQNSSNGLMKEITPEMGEVLDQKFSYMSTHSGSYKQLKDCPDLVREIAHIEKGLEKQAPYYYIQQKDIDSKRDLIKNGDIVCFVSPIEGLDISHVALAYWDKGELKFIHASFREKKVVIDKQTIADYAKNGVRFVRLAD